MNPFTESTVARPLSEPSPAAPETIALQIHARRVRLRFLPIRTSGLPVIRALAGWSGLVRAAKYCDEPAFAGRLPAGVLLDPCWVQCWRFPCLRPGP